MQKIDEKTWDAVRLTEIFDTISRGKRIKKSDHIPGNVPYVSSTALANGTDGNCGNEKGVRKFGDCLTMLIAEVLVPAFITLMNLLPVTM